jgi:Type VI secretion system, TssF
LTSSITHSNTPRTDPNPTRTLEGRLAQQAHWRLAPSVQRGEQSATDPDAYQLEELQEGLRLYSIREQQRRTVEGRKVLVTQRLTKRLVDGRWTTVYEVEHVRPA